MSIEQLLASILATAAAELRQDARFVSDGIPMPPRSKCSRRQSYRVKLKDKRRKP